MTCNEGTQHSRNHFPFFHTVAIPEARARLEFISGFYQGRGKERDQVCRNFLTALGALR